MKISKVASGFRRDPKTIKRITDDYPTFFTDDAVREEEGKRTQRFFHVEDLEVINSILRWEYEGLDHTQISTKLDEGERERDLPPDFTNIEGENALTVYAELRTMRLQIEQYQERIAEITGQYEDRIDQLTGQLDAKDETIADLNEAHRRELVEVAREAERWKVRYEDLKERLEKDTNE